MEKSNNNLYTIVIEKEYYSISSTHTTPTIGCLMMVKNEEKDIHITLDTTVGYVDCYIIYDTGSTDNTIEVIKKHAEKHKINLYMIQGEFVNFCVSRNVSLEYADKIDVNFLLLMDTCDELRGGDELKKFAIQEKTTDNDTYLLCQEWWSGNYDKYFNIRLIKPRCSLRYNGSVHEWIGKTPNIEVNKLSTSKPTTAFRMPDKIILYQDRIKYGGSSKKRFTRDKILLYNDYKKDKKHPRTLFYLAQTCACLGEIEEAFYYYKLRSELDGFLEEKFHSILKCGNFSTQLNHDWSTALIYYMKAIEQSEDRAEPMIKIAQYYASTKKWYLAFTFANMACSLPYPERCILFVDSNCYKYTRWSVLGIVGYYCNKYKEGKIGCLKAIDAGLNIPLDTNNLKFYLDKEKELATPPVVNKKDFVQGIIKKLRHNNNNMSNKKLQKIALQQWKANKM
jgi:glycosyltransferase involved in cell wall biosynthesis